MVDLSLSVISPFMPTRMKYPSLTHRASPFPFLRVVVRLFSFLFRFYYSILHANSGDPDQTPRSVASDLGLYWLLMSQKRTLGLYVLTSVMRCGEHIKSLL